MVYNMVYMYNNVTVSVHMVLSKNRRDKCKLSKKKGTTDCQNKAMELHWYLYVAKCG